MRLLNVYTLELQSFGDDHRPPYVIASHRWLEDEATYKDVLKRRNEDKAGYQKLRSFCEFVRTRMQKSKCKYLWIDTCCIDKSSSAELQEAINSMFRWYAEALVCVAYLHDVDSIPDKVMGTFETSIWFSRGWTLQELLAPSAVIFLNSAWEPFGVKSGDGITVHPLPSLNEDIFYITNIPEDILRNFANSKRLTVEQKQQWMRGRETTRIEDMAYCQLGILGVFMPLIYGSQDEAMVKLKEELKKKSKRSRARLCENRQPRHLELEPPPRYLSETEKYTDSKLYLWEQDLMANVLLGHCSLRVEILDAFDLTTHNINTFCTFSLHGDEVYKTNVAKNTSTPVWNEVFEIGIRSPIRCDLLMCVWEAHRLTKARDIGRSTLPVATLEPYMSKEYHIQPSGLGGTVRVKMLCKPG